MIIECPHCFTSVVPAGSGECPACRSNVNDTEGLDRTKTSLSVRCGSTLPEVCCGCGAATDRLVRVRSAIPKQGGESTWLIAIASLFGGLLGAMVQSSVDPNQRSGDVLVVDLPQCTLCAPQGNPEPIRVNRDERVMTFVVHEDLKAANG